MGQVAKHLLYTCLALPPHPHLCPRIIIQAPLENLVAHLLIILHVENFRQTNLPWRVTGQLNMRAEQDKEVRLAHYALAQLGVNQLHGDVRRLDFAALRHLCEGFGQVNDRVASVFGGYEEDRKLLRGVAVRQSVGGKSGFLGRDVGSGSGEKGIVGAEICLKPLAYGAMGFGDVAFEDA